MTDQIRWGILSTARIAGKSMIPALHASRNGVLAAVASRDLGKAREFAAANHIPTAYGSYEDLLADPAIDAIYNPLPNSLHAEWALKAADAGKHVLCEKPFTVTSSEARQVVEHFHARNLLVMEALMYRYHPQTERVRRMVEDGAVGEVHMIDAAFTIMITDPNNIRFRKSVGGGSLLDVGCYPVSMIRHLAGEPNRWAAFATYNADGVDLRAAGALGFASGIGGTFACDLQGFRAHYCDIRGTTGRIYVRTPYSIPKDQPTIVDYWHGDQYEEIMIPPANHYTLMVEDFADALLQARAPRFPAEEAIIGMETLEKLIALAEANAQG